MSASVCRAVFLAILPVTLGGADLVLPSVRVTPNRGEAFPLRSWQGDVVVVNFWATWCAPCRDEMRDFQRLADSGDAKVIGISVDEGGWPTVTPFLRQHDIRFPVALSNRAILRAFGFRGRPPVLPQTFIFDGQGKLLLHARTALTLADLREVLSRDRPGPR
jgi:thiol-disulfide isomerase/thioredoxin